VIRRDLSVGVFVDLKKENPGLFLIYALSLFSFVNYNLSNYILGLILIYTTINYKSFIEYYKKDKLLIIFCIYMAYIVISSISFVYIYPEIYKQQVYSIMWWMAPWAFIFVSWIVRGRHEIIYNMFMFCLLGFITNIIIKTDWFLIDEWLSGSRYKFGYPWLLTSLYCGIFLSCIYIFRSKFKKKYILGLLAIVIIFLFFVLIISQSRGMLVLLILLLFFSLIYNINNFRDKKIQIFITFLCILIFSISQYKIVNSRTSEEKSTYSKILSSNINEIPYTSIGARIHLYDYALYLVKEKPFFGWGPGTSATRYLTTREDVEYPVNDKLQLSRFTHLHNIFLEISVRFGVIGFIVHLLIFFYFINICFFNKINILKDNVYTFFLTFIFLNISFNMYDFRYIYKDYRYVFIVFLGIFFSRYMHLRNKITLAL